MCSRKVWTEQQDRILKLLKEERGQKKWSVIAKKMESQFKIEGRTGKQCRERYHNHLDSNIITSEWTDLEEQTLFDMHQEVGNKWSVISQKLPGRSDNCVKNHFYSKLRKSLRKLNKLVEDRNQATVKEIKNSTLYKIIEITEERFKINSKVDEEIIDLCLNIKNSLYIYGKSEEQKESNQSRSVRNKLIGDIHLFELGCKKSQRSAKKHKGSLESITADIKMFQQTKEEKQCEKAQQQIPFSQVFIRICQELMHQQL